MPPGTCILAWDLGVDVGLRHAPGNWQLNGQSPGQPLEDCKQFYELDCNNLRNFIDTLLFVVIHAFVWVFIAPRAIFCLAAASLVPFGCSPDFLHGPQSISADKQLVCLVC